MDIFLPHVSQSISYMKNTAATHQGTHFYKIYRLLYSILIYFKKREKKSYSKTAKITGEKERKCLMMSRGFSIKELIEGGERYRRDDSSKSSAILLYSNGEFFLSDEAF